MIETQEKRFKKGQILYHAGDFELNMYNILYGSVAVYVDYGAPDERKIMEVREGDFLNVVSFLESRPRNSTVVALEPTVVSVIDIDNFGAYFRERPAKIMSLLQHMSARMRHLQKAYLEACNALKENVGKEKLREDEEFYDRQSRMYHWVQSMFPSLENDEPMAK